MSVAIAALAVSVTFVILAVTVRLRSGRIQYPKGWRLLKLQVGQHRNTCAQREADGLLIIEWGSLPSMPIFVAKSQELQIVLDAALSLEDAMQMADDSIPVGVC